jgi:haloalkane dehalogenase
MISAKSPYNKKRMNVLGQSMAYIEVGSGDPIVLLHGNPTSSYLWRNVIPHLQELGRCIAPDLIGMGDSEKLPDSGPGSYTFVEHRRYVDALLAALSMNERVTFVVHDWGSALVRPLTWDEMPEALRPVFQALRSEAGEAMVLEQNLFVEELLPRQILRGLTEGEMAHYRRPFAEPCEGRRPTLTWPRQVPLDGEPADVVKIMNSYAQWLTNSTVPKLFVNGEPGGILIGTQREFCRSWPAQTEVTVRGLHFLQEDSPDEIGQAIVNWMKRA